MRFLNLRKNKQRTEIVEKKFKTNVFKSLDDLPLYNWMKVYNEHDFRFLIVGSTTENIDSLKFRETDLVHGWNQIYDEYMTDFGLTAKFKRIFKLERKIALLTCEMLLNDHKKHLATKISIAKQQLSEHKGGNKNETADFSKQIAYVEKWMSIPIDPKNISTKRFYTYLQMYDAEAQRVSKKMNDGKN